jgi:hypothetical protein
MTELRDVLMIGIVLVAALAVSAGLEIATDLEEGAPVATTSADETAATATDALQFEWKMVGTFYAMNIEIGAANEKIR